MRMVRTGVLALAVIGTLSACESAPSQTVTAAGAAAPMPPPVAAPAPMRAGAGMVFPGAAIVAPPSGDRFTEVQPGTRQSVAEAPVSTFSIDVDTASYAYVRRLLRDGRLPPRDAVRIEEMVNYFPYAYAGPDSRDAAFRANVTVAPSPWNKQAKLLHVGIKGWDVPRQTRPRANLTFLIDVSGSMAPEDRLPLIQKALRQLGDGLRPDDTVAIVAYAGGAGIRLEPTKGSELPRILAAVESLRAGGATAGDAGIRTAYALAERMFDKDAVNRVILATDGDFNVGESNPRRLEELITEKRKTGIYLTVLGVGIGNLNDALMQRLAQSGNGQAAYLDSLLEARKVWIEELGSTMVPIADDVKVQVEFNPAQVAEYRLIGYETRALRRADFNNDAVDAGEIGSGHSVTAIYEFLPAGKQGLIEPLRYASTKRKAAKGAASDEIAFVKLRAKPPGGGDSRLSQRAVGAADAVPDLAAASDDVRFSVAVAGFAQMLRGQTSDAGWDDTIALADGARGADPHGWRAEAVQLMRLARTLKR